MDDISYLQAQLSRYYGQPYSPYSTVEAIAWEKETGIRLVSIQEADTIKVQLKERFSVQNKTENS